MAVAVAVAVAVAGGGLRTGDRSSHGEWNPSALVDDGEGGVHDADADGGSDADRDEIQSHMFAITAAK